MVDRRIRDEAGEFWLVDYNTSRHEGVNIEGFLGRKQKRYAARLDAYAESLGGASRGLYFFPPHAGRRKHQTRDMAFCHAHPR